MNFHKSSQDFTTRNGLQTVQVSHSFDHSLSQSPTGIGHQYVPNGIQHNPGAFQPNQPQLVAYPQQAQAPAPASQGTGLVQAQKLQFLSAAPLGVLGAGAAPVDCPRCGVRAVTRTSYVSGNTTHLWALGLCLCVCLPCIPYLMGSTKDVKHHCGHCGVQLATWYRSGNIQVFA